MRGLLLDAGLAARNLLEHRRRSAFLGGAIAVVTALFVLLLGLSSGVRDTMFRSATTLMTGHVNVGGFFKVTAGQAAPVVHDYPRLVESVERSVPGIAAVIPRVRGWAKLVSDTASVQVGLHGVEIAREPDFRAAIQLAEGSLDALAGEGTILLFESQAKKLGVRAGDALTLSAYTSRGAGNTADVVVAGIARDAGLFSVWNVYLPAATLRALYQLNERTTGALHVFLEDPGRAREVAESLRATLLLEGHRALEPDPVAFWMKFEKVNREDWTGQKLDVTTWRDEISFVLWTLTALDALTGLLVGILVVIVAIGIMNTLWIAIRERTREIGTLRAIGMRRGRVLRLFLLEATLLGVASATLGALLAAAVGAALNAAAIEVPETVQLFLMSRHLRVLIDPAVAGRAVGLIALATALSALYPALRAARLRPVVAMQHAG